MKKVIIYGYFIFIGVFSFFLVKGAATLKMDETDINYRKLSDNLSDKEIVEAGIQRHDGKKYVKYYETVETRTKKLFGWDTKIDTLKTYTMEENCGCGN